MKAKTEPVVNFEVEWSPIDVRIEGMRVDVQMPFLVSTSGTGLKREVVGALTDFERLQKKAKAASTKAKASFALL